MTTPTPLAETIARVEQQLALEPPVVSCVVLHRDDTMALLSCARRVVAMEGVADSEVIAHIRASVSERDEVGTWKSPEFRAGMHALLDAASEHAVLAKRVEELEGTDFIAYTNELVAEADRLRAENERLANIANARQHDINSAAVARLELALTAAQDRVRELQTELDLYKQGQAYTGWREAQKRARELEETGQELRDVTREAEWPRACRAWDRAKKATGPITDPTQWAGTVGRHFVSTRELDHMEIAVADAEGLLDVGSCIPPDCQHYIELPSGAGVEVMIDWRPIETCPAEGEFLVYLEAPMLNTRFHTMKCPPMMVRFGCLPTHWAPLTPPEGK
jgi:hypothetical protein